MIFKKFEASQYIERPNLVYFGIEKAKPGNSDTHTQTLEPCNKADSPDGDYFIIFPLISLSLSLSLSLMMDPLTLIFDGAWIEQTASL